MTTPLEGPTAGRGSILDVTATLLGDRQLIVEKADVSGTGKERSLRLKVRFSRDVPFLRIRVLRSGVKNAVPIELYDTDLTGTAGGAKLVSKNIVVPLGTSPAAPAGGSPPPPRSCS